MNPLAIMPNTFSKFGKVLSEPLLTTSDKQHLRHKRGFYLSPMAVLRQAGSQGISSFSRPTRTFSSEGIDTSFHNKESMATVILIDAGYFVGRMQKHWSPKGKRH